MKNYINFALILVVALITVGCADISKIEVGGVKGVTISSIDAIGVNANLSIDVKNGLNSKIGVSKLEADILSGDKVLLHITLTEKVFAKAHWQGVAQVPIRIRTSGTSIASMYSLFTRNENLRLKGYSRIRLGAAGQTILFDEEISSGEVRKMLNL